MIKYCYGAFVWFLIALLMYGTADIVGKGQVLNRMTPFPVLGYILWLLVLFFLWKLLIKPIIDFWWLSCKSRCSLQNRAKALHRRLRDLDRAKRLLEGARDAYVRLDTAITKKDWKPDVLNPIFEECKFHDTLCTEARRIILSHSRAAALATAFSRNAVLDGFCMLIVQMKLVVALARLYGYKPSPVFNTCCFVWVAANSVISALLSAAVENVAEGIVSGIGGHASDEALFGEDLCEVTMGGVEDGFLIGAEAVGQRIATFTIGILMEAVSAGAAVYVTGKIFCSKLDGEWEKPTFGMLVKLRREGRLAIGKGIPEMAKGLATRLGSVGKETIVSVYKNLHDVVFDEKVN